MARFPGLRSDALIGALQYYDAQMDDARLAVAIARTAPIRARTWPRTCRSSSGRGETPDGLHASSCGTS